MNIHSITIAIFLAASVSHAQGMNMDKPAPNLAETLDPDLLDIKNAIRDCQATDLINKKISFHNLLYDPCKSMSFLKYNRDQLLASAEVAIVLAKAEAKAYVKNTILGQGTHSASTRLRLIVRYENALTNQKSLIAHLNQE